MDYSEARDAFFGPRSGDVAELGWQTPARRVRDAIEPIATICFWSEPAYDALAARGLDFLQGYVWGRASVLGEPDAGVVVSAFGVFEPGLIASTYDAGRAVCSVDDIRTARIEGVSAALRGAIGEPPAELAATIAALRRATDAAPSVGRAFFAGTAGLPWPDDEWAQLWHVCSLLREHRGDAHLAALIGADLDGAAANLLTEFWVGWEPSAYAGSRAWSPEALDAALATLTSRGYVADGVLTDAGRSLREQLEATTDDAEASVVAALGDDLDDLVTRLDGWSQQIVDAGWFPPDPYKRASG